MMDVLATENLSYEDRLKAEARARRLRLIGRQKTVNVINDVLVAVPEPIATEPIIEDPPEETGPQEPLSEIVPAKRYARPTLVMIKNEPAAHVRNWRKLKEAYTGSQGAKHLAMLICKARGVEWERLRGSQRHAALVAVRREIIVSINNVFPALSSPQIGRIVNLDHTSVLYHLGWINTERKKAEMRKYLFRRRQEKRKGQA